MSAPARACRSGGAVLLLTVAALAITSSPAGAQVRTGTSVPAVVSPPAPVLTAPEERDDRRADQLGSDATSRGVVVGSMVLVVVTLGAATIALSGWRP